MSRLNPLQIVKPAQPEPEPEHALAGLVPELIELEHGISVIRQRIDAERIRLAKKRGVAFIRPEHVRREFGG